MFYLIIQINPEQLNSVLTELETEISENSNYTLILAGTILGGTYIFSFIASIYKARSFLRPFNILSDFSFFIYDTKEAHLNKSKKSGSENPEKKPIAHIDDVRKI